MLSVRSLFKFWKQLPIDWNALSPSKHDFKATEITSCLPQAAPALWLVDKFRQFSLACEWPIALPESAREHKPMRGGLLAKKTNVKTHGIGEAISELHRQRWPRPTKWQRLEDTVEEWLCPMAQSSCKTVSILLLFIYFMLNSLQYACFFSLNITRKE